MLIQDATADPALQTHPAIRMGLTRYLGVPVANPNGEAIGTLCFLDDRSDVRLGEEDIHFLSLLGMRVSAELERERSTRERLAEREAMVARLEAVNARLRRASEEKRRLIATVIHDLRQPLTALRTTLYCLRQEEDPAEREASITLLEGRLAALSALTDELGEYARLEAGQVPWKLARTPLAPLLRECVEGFAPEACARRVRVRCELPPTLGEAETDSAKLCHVVSNLIANAITFAAAGEADSSAEGEHAGSVVVRAASEGASAWRLVVEDDGPGIPDAVLEHIFEEFYQGTAAPQGAPPGDQSRGLGLGLAIVDYLCAGMGAQIEVASVPGLGTRFAVTFPRLFPPAGEVES